MPLYMTVSVKCFVLTLYHTQDGFISCCVWYVHVKRFLPHLRQDKPRASVLTLGDGVYSEEAGVVVARVERRVRMADLSRGVGQRLPQGRNDIRAWSKQLSK